MEYNEKALLDLVQEKNEMLIITPTIRKHAWDAVENDVLRHRLQRRDKARKKIMQAVRYFLEELDGAIYGTNIKQVK